MRTVIFQIVVSAALLSPTGLAQDPKLQFEVATVKLALPLSGRTAAEMAKIGVHGGPGSEQPELLSMDYMSLHDLLIRAFGVRVAQLSGPAWLSESPGPKPGQNKFFDVTAKVPLGATKAEADIMLQNLLAERFGLVFHREKKESAGYELRVSKDGSKLTVSRGWNTATAPPPTPPAASCPESSSPGFLQNIDVSRNNVPLPRRTGLLQGSFCGKRFISGRSMTMDEIASALEDVLGKPVADRTGLQEKYDFGLGFDGANLLMRFPGVVVTQQANATSQAADPVPSIFTAVQRELGLRLDQAKIAVDLIVIEKLEKAPGDN